ncbi:MAG: GntR family transcriptional regulator [Anaerolineae bacterium]|nr:GntR family transcriptional regulator [Anaerolineae bacterium]
MVATSDAIAQYLREAILRGELKSQSPLPQDKIANELGVSKVPLREALAELKSEGLITYKANRGAFVTSLSAADAHEIYLMRLALETMALRQAIPKMTKVDVARPRSALLMIDAEDNPQNWAALNWDFHEALYQSAAMPHLLATIKTLHINVGRYLLLYLDKMAFQTKSQEEHHEILNACIQQDAELACRILETHLADASQSLQDYLRSMEGNA